jgi:hypothetical protein
MVIDDSIIPEKKNTSTKPQFGLKIKGFYLVFLWQMHDLTCLLKIAVTQGRPIGVFTLIAKSTQEFLKPHPN